MTQAQWRLGERKDVRLHIDGLRLPVQSEARLSLTTGHLAQLSQKEYVSKMCLKTDHDFRHFMSLDFKIIFSVV